MATSNDSTTPLPSSAEEAEEHAQSGSPPDAIRPLQSPPFWRAAPHGRAISSASSIIQSRPQIQLEDHSDSFNDSSRACWARRVSIDDYTVVSGPTGIGAYVVWNCKVETLTDSTPTSPRAASTSFTVRKRYSQFDKLREDLVGAFPNATSAIPELPRKSVVSRFRERFLEQRRVGLEHFLNCVLLNPEFSSSPILKDFIFDEA